MSEDATVVVVGVGRVDVTPDVVLVGLGVQVVAPDPGAALRQVDEHVRRLQALLDDAGIPAAARRTTYLAVNPVHGPQGEELAKQSAFYGLDVTVADLAAAGRLVQDAAEALGTALRVHRFALQVRDVGPHLERARRDAVQSAADKALQLAQASGLRLGPLLTLVESGASGGGGMWMTEQSGRVAGMAVEPGEQAVSTSVTATYRLLAP
jgi:uncharacterized protein YggE